MGGAGHGVGVGMCACGCVGGVFPALHVVSVCLCTCKSCAPIGLQYPKSMAEVVTVLVLPLPCHL